MLAVRNALCACLCALVLTTRATFAGGDPYIGIGHEVSENPPGLRISVVAGTPGYLAGLRSGDVITAINGVAFSASSELPYPQQLSAALKGLEVGDMVTFTVFRDSAIEVITKDGLPVPSDTPLRDLPGIVEQAGLGVEVEYRAVRKPLTLDIPVTLGARPGTDGNPILSNEGLTCNLPDVHPELRNLLSALIGERGIESDCADLRARLDRRATPNDGYRLERVSYLLRDGLKSEAVTRSITSQLSVEVGKGIDGYSGAQEVVAQLLDLHPQAQANSLLPQHMSANEHLDSLQHLLEEADAHIRSAFSAYTDDELEFIGSQRSGMTKIFAGGNYIQEEDPDPKNVQANLRLIELAKKLDYAELSKAQLTLAQLANKAYLDQLHSDLAEEFETRLSEGDLLVRETGLGKLIVSGSGRSWRQGEAPALLIDLGGDDFYTTTEVRGERSLHSLTVMIEFGGDDAYESTTPYTQGSGSLGCSLLMDLDGDDQYLGLQWAQACGFFGMGALLDLAGDDVYRGEELCQAAAIFGSGLLIDYAGNDRMEGQNKCQAFGGSHGVGVVIDCAGDDFRYAKGKYPTNYGDAGIFDAWSQGCAQGFRGYASGGIAGIVDFGGADYSEAGNFSQGGGYYFGYGFIHDLGCESDVYVGSRYNQGFSAHQAVGAFLEEGGNDYYTTRQGVAQGLAWDECSTMFIDYAGDDRFEGGAFFGQGASAHNSLCVMWDRAGNDVYNYPIGQARTGGNDYHGGSSLSMFVDEGGGSDSYDWPQSANSLATGWKEHGFFCDLPGTLSASLEDLAVRRLWRDTQPQ